MKRSESGDLYGWLLVWTEYTLVLLGATIATIMLLSSDAISRAGGAVLLWRSTAALNRLRTSR